MTVDFGLVLPARPEKGKVEQWEDNLDAVLPELEADFKSLWMTDHFFWEDEPTYEAWTVMAYAAARWPQFDIGPMVLGQSYRNPALTAKMGATLQSISQGRFIMAIGSGWKEDEYLAYGYPLPSLKTRLEELEDALEIITRMWTAPDPVTYRGKHYQIVNAYCQPKPDPVPPIIVGGGGKTTTLLAARYADWWNLYDAGLDKYRDRLGYLREHCRNIGRDPESIRLTWFGRLSLGRSMEEAVGRSGGKRTPDNAIVGAPRQVIEQIKAFHALGVDYFMVDILDVTEPAVRRMLLEEVLPEVKAGKP